MGNNRHECIFARLPRRCKSDGGANSDFKDRLSPPALCLISSPITERETIMAGAGQRDRDLRERAAAVIPGGMFGHQATGMLPDDYPQFFSRAKGAWLWDADGNRLLDFMCAYGPNLMGYGHETIDAAYIAQMQIGDTLTGPTERIVELAEALTTLRQNRQTAEAAVFRAEQQYERPCSGAVACL